MRARDASGHPARTGSHEGLAYVLLEPDGEPLGGVVILHGSGSCKESHLDFARAACSWGLAAVAFDQRGHGETGGELDAEWIADVGRIATLLPQGPVALRGSSMGGYLALVAAEVVSAEAVVAICPASAEGLRRALIAATLDVAADTGAFERLLAENDATVAVAALRAPLLLMHAEGDEVVPIEHSRMLVEAAGSPVKRLIEMPGGHHRSVAHDPELQGVSLQFIERAFAGGAPTDSA